ncbi:hypothetical protein [Mangrovicella endophytica]|uniref:hypothetical protein n=1 Tax=Mangrovicella endophytica TaxID=2066697 RepID=UPI000C9DA974|nr:hypothetical protein [Mangrovicella endophytica]
MPRQTIARSGFALLSLVLASAALAQTEPRQIPEGFVLPGPAPTGGGAAAPASPPPAPAAGATAPAGTKATAEPVGVATAEAKAKGPSWPCVQRRVDVVAAAQVWRGPDLESAGATARTPEMQRLVDEVAARRLPLPEAQKRVTNFVKSLPEADRAAAATALFADLLVKMNGERAEIIGGIERYAERQKALATKLRDENAALDKLRADTKTTPEELDAAQQEMLWNDRIFEERRQSLTYVCEVPQLIEQRLFALGRSLADAL